jgi:hypothetical protein
MSGRFNIIKQFFTKSGDGKVIRSVKPNVPKTKLEKATSNLDKAIQRNKASRAKLGQTIFESKNKAFKGKDDFTFTKTNKKTESNKEAYKRIQGENTKVLKSMIDDAFKDKNKKTKVFKAPKNFNKGGRVGLKRGTGLMKKKSDIQKIKETFSPKKSAAKKSTKFGMLSVKAGIDKNPNPTQADRIAGAKMKSKKRFV